MTGNALRKPEISISTAIAASSRPIRRSSAIRPDLPIRRASPLADSSTSHTTTMLNMVAAAQVQARLSAHLGETRHILTKGGQVGKRLDFMMQELNREANTLGAKASVKELADASMDLKLLIEQMREQVQNLE